MTAVTTPNVHPESAADTDGQSINLYRLGMLFIVRCRYRTCCAGNDADAASKLTQLKQQIAGLTGEDLAQQPDVAASLSRACVALKANILNPDAVSQLTGRLKRRVVLD